MGFIKVFTYPIQVTLEHNDNVVEWIDTGWDDLQPVYTIRTVLWEEMGGLSWSVKIEREGLPTFEGTLNPLETGSKNLPTPQRFRSDAMTARLNWQRV